MINISVLFSRRYRRNIFRTIIGGVGAFSLYQYASTGFFDHFAGMMGMMFVMMAATNFCTQCPLLSGIKRMLGRGPSRSIETDRIG